LGIIGVITVIFGGNSLTLILSSVGIGGIVGLYWILKDIRKERKEKLSKKIYRQKLKETKLDEGM
jgi:uncharacterized membrane protein